MAIKAHIQRRLSSNTITSTRHLYYVFPALIRLDPNNIISIVKGLSEILTLLELPALVTSFPCAINRNRGVTFGAPMVCQVKVERGARDKDPFPRPDQCMIVEHGMTEIPEYSFVFFVCDYIPLEVTHDSNSGVVVLQILRCQTNVRAIAHVPYGVMVAHSFDVPL